jgi:hypothetical protein
VRVEEHCSVAHDAPGLAPVDEGHAAERFTEHSADHVFQLHAEHCSPGAISERAGPADRVSTTFQHGSVELKRTLHIATPALRQRERQDHAERHPVARGAPHSRRPRRERRRGLR